MSLLEETVPYEILYYFVSTWLTIPHIHILKQLNKYFYTLVHDVLNSKKYNTSFITSQLKLLNPELRKTSDKLRLLDDETDNIMRQKQELEDALLKIDETRELLSQHQTNLSSYVNMFNERLFGEPNVWLLLRPGFQKLHGLERPFKFMLNYSVTDYSDLKYYNLSYVVTQQKSKTWIWIDNTKNTESQLMYVDNFMMNIGWIKFFPLKHEKNVAFLYVHPKEPFLDQIHRTRFYNCTICNSRIHSIHNCKKAKCKKCKKTGHTTNTCKSKFHNRKYENTQNTKFDLYGTRTILKKNQSN